MRGEWTAPAHRRPPDIGGLKTIDVWRDPVRDRARCVPGRRLWAERRSAGDRAPARRDRAVASRAWHTEAGDAEAVPVSSLRHQSMGRGQAAHPQAGRAQPEGPADPYIATTADGKYLNLSVRRCAKLTVRFRVIFTHSGSRPWRPYRADCAVSDSRHSLRQCATRSRRSARLACGRAPCRRRCCVGHRR